MRARRTDEERNWRIARITGGLASVGLGVDALVGSPVGVTHAQLAAIAVCGAIWIWSLAHRELPTMTTSNIVILTLNATIIVALTSAAQRLAESGIDWVPFRPHQLGAMAVALLAPPAAWVGVAAIVGFVGTAAIQYALFDAAIRERLPFGDPLSTLIYGGFAIVLLFFRRRADKTEREVIRAHADAESSQRHARAMLAIRDLANTPLQTLANMTTLLRHRGTLSDEDLARIERSVARLTELEHATQPFEHGLEWDPGDESWDPRAVLTTHARRT